MSQIAKPMPQSPTAFNTPKVHALIVAAGVGSRFGGELPKQYRQVCGKTILEHSVSALAKSDWLYECTIVVSLNDEMVHHLAFELPVRLVLGGKERADSVSNGVEKIAKTAHLDDVVLIHDAARPCLLKADLDRLIETAIHEPYGAILAVPVADTLKFSSDNHTIAQTIPRQGLWQAQTPQVYRLRHLLTALSYLKKNNRQSRKALLKNSTDAVPSLANSLLTSNAMTDEAMAFEQLGLPIALVQGSSSNIKLTYEADLCLIEVILSHYHNNDCKDQR